MVPSIARALVKAQRRAVREHELAERTKAALEIADDWRAG
jgi:hypothetical protein